MRNFLLELKRRNVVRVAVVYAVAAWLMMQIVDVMFPALNLPLWTITAVAALILVGFPFALIFAWAFELTPDGIKREKDVDRSQSITAETGKKLNTITMAILALAVAFLMFDKFVLQRQQVTSVQESTPSASTRALIRSVAVLPFVNMSGDAENEYFSDGLSEELLNVLAKIPELKIAGRTSSFQFKGSNQDLRDIGNKLNVESILEGSVRKSGARVRITAQLIDARDGYHLWSETYDREIDDIFAVQDEIAEAVGSALEIELLGTSASPLESTKVTDNVEAYSLYLQGRYLRQRLTEQNIGKSIELLSRAVELDPMFAAAWAQLAISLSRGGSGFSLNGESAKSILKRAREYATRAIELEDKNSAGYVALGYVLLLQSQFAESEQQLNRALQLDPNNVDALHYYMFAVGLDGRRDDSLRAGQRAVELDPLSFNVNRDINEMKRHFGYCEEAVEGFRNLMVMQGDAARIHGFSGLCLIELGKLDEGKAEINQEPTEWLRDLGNIVYLRRAGQSEAWLQAVAEYKDQHHSYASYQVAQIYAEAGESDAAFEWLEAALQTGDAGLSIMKIDTLMRPIRSDPRWQPFVKKVASSRMRR